jgi:rhomboid protease GluP
MRGVQEKIMERVHMISSEAVGKTLQNCGYQYCKARPETIGLYYQYIQGNIHVVVVVDLDTEHEMTPEQHAGMESHLRELFCQPQGKIPEFPEEQQVYQVELLTVFCSSFPEKLRGICAQCPNAWGYLQGTGQLLIYENQPGDFYGLRDELEGICLSEQSYVGQSGQTGPGKNAGGMSVRQMPIVTVGLIVINVLVYLVMEICGDTLDGGYIAAYGGLYPKFVLEDQEWWRLLTAGFIHFGAAHLINNMVIFACIGNRLERTMGHIRMLIIYVVSLLGASAFSLYMMVQSGDYAVAAGASGAVFGTIGAMLWAVILHKGKLEGLTTRRMIFMIVLSMYYGFTSTGTDNWGHIGGLLMGFVAAMLLYHGKKLESAKKY